uniref:Uncharacterized protein n=1 Tax=Anguilla anguilla TaxID=7936 RepID=A0A0E9WKI0_ANGAN
MVLEHGGILTSAESETVAIANSPQSEPPACCWTSGHCSRTLFPGKARRHVTCAMKFSVFCCPRESKTLTVPTAYS